MSVPGQKRTNAGWSDCPLSQEQTFRRLTMAWHDQLCNRSMEKGITFKIIPGRRTASAL